MKGEVTVLRDAATGDVRFQFAQGNQRDPYRLAFTPDGKTLVAMDGTGGFKTWDNGDRQGASGRARQTQCGAERLRRG